MVPWRSISAPPASGCWRLVSMLLIGALGTRLWFLQGVEAASFQAKVSAAKIREVLIPPERGRIFDAKGRIMADNQRILTVAIDWSVIKKPKNRDALFNRLSGSVEGAGHRSAAPIRAVLRRADHPEVHQGSTVQHAAAAAVEGRRRRRHGHVPEGAQRGLPRHPDRRAVEACLSVRAVGQPRRRLPRPDHQGDGEAVQGEELQHQRTRRRVRCRAVDGGHVARLVGQASVRGRRSRRHRPRVARSARRPGCRPATSS